MWLLGRLTVWILKRFVPCTSEIASHLLILIDKFHSGITEVFTKGFIEVYQPHGKSMYEIPCRKWIMMTSTKLNVGFWQIVLMYRSLATAIGLGWGLLTVCVAFKIINSASLAFEYKQWIRIFRSKRDDCSEVMLQIHQKTPQRLTDTL